jgi:hypothetical protein
MEENKGDIDGRRIPGKGRQIRCRVVAPDQKLAGIKGLFHPDGPLQ